MRVKIKKLDKEAVVPGYASEGDAGLDLTATSMEYTHDYLEYGTGLSVEIPEGYVGLLFPRSSVSKIDLMLANSVGVIDSGYRGEIKLRFNFNPLSYINARKEYKVGDRIGQLIIIPYPKIELDIVEELEDTDRGDGGFGSSGE